MCEPTDGLHAVERRIGYTFNNFALLESAFTHSSYVNEHKATGNERIEFLGDCVLNFLVGERFFFDDRTASEGSLSKRRAAVVSSPPLARIVDSLGFIEYLRVGVGVDKSGFSDKPRSDLFEAILGAVYLDGGMQACRSVLDAIYYPFVTPERDYKSDLQLYAAAHKLPPPEYVIEQVGKGFDCAVRLGDKVYSGRGKNKAAAEREAARAAIESVAPRR